MMDQIFKKLIQYSFFFVKNIKIRGATEIFFFFWFLKALTKSFLFLSVFLKALTLSFSLNSGENILFI